MQLYDAAQVADDATFTISGTDLKMLLRYGQTMNSGYAPKGEMCFLYGKSLLGVVERAEPLEANHG